MLEAIDICNFTRGELSPRLRGRTDYASYYAGAETQLNAVTLPQGGATRRPGTMLAAIGKLSGVTGAAMKLIPFVFSTVQPYMLEVSAPAIANDASIRPCKNDALILAGGTVTGAVNNGSGKVRLTVTSTIGIAGNSGTDFLTVSGIAGTIEANGIWSGVTIVDTTHVDLPVNFVNAYIAGGTATMPVDILNYGALTVPMAVTGSASDSGTIRLTLNATGPLAGATSVLVTGVQGTVEANGYWPFTIIDGTHIDLTGSAFVNAFAAGAAAVQGFVPTAIPWLNADLAALEYTQSNDTLYIFGGSCTGAANGYPAMTLTRSSHVSWTLNQMVFLDGPYLGLNTTGTTLIASAAAGAITIKASSIYGINVSPGNSGVGFLATDVGRHVRIANAAGNASGWAIITGYTSPTQVSAVVMPAVPNGALGAMPTAASTYWQLGKWAPSTGYPYLGAFWQQRLAMLGTNNQPGAVEASNTGSFGPQGTIMAPSAPQSAAADNNPASNALSWVIADDQVNAIRWVSPAGSAVAQQLGIGTTGGEDVMQPATTSAAVSTTNVQVYRETSIGSAPSVKPLRVGKAVLFADRPGRKLIEWVWAWVVNGYLPNELTVDSEHITAPMPTSLQGITCMAYQQAPFGVIWCCLGDGSLIGFTYKQEQKVFAAHRHQLGGQYYGGPPQVLSVATIPSPDQSYDEVWLAVLRTIGGAPTLTTEVMTRYFDKMPLEQSWFVDCGIQSALTMPAASLTPPALINSATQGRPPKFAGVGIYTASAPVFAGNATDMGKIIRVNNGIAQITGFIDTEHVTATSWSAMNNLAPALSGNWSCTAPVNAVSGAAYLAGETAQILGDGADFGALTVPNTGIVPLAAPGASLVTVGLPSDFVLVTMPFNPQRAIAASAGKSKRIDHIYLRLLETVALNYGMKRVDPDTGVVDDPTDAIELRQPTNAANQPPPLYSGVIKLPMPGGFDLEGMMEFNTSGPFPATITAIGARADVADTNPNE